MRLFFMTSALAVMVCSATAAQTCETMNVRDVSGQIVSTSQMCVDANGAWVDPASVGVADAVTLQPAPAYTPYPAPQPVYSAPLLAQSLADQSMPLQVVTVEAAPVYQPVAGPARAAAAFVPQPMPLSAGSVERTVKPSWQPTSGSEKREKLYAQLGLVCRATKAVFCGPGNACTGLCEGQSGWCDGKTGEAHNSLASIERANCRKKRR